MAQRIRVEAYLDYETVVAMEDETENRSQFIREAVAEKLERES